MFSTQNQLRNHRLNSAKVIPVIEHSQTVSQPASKELFIKVDKLKINRNFVYERISSILIHWFHA